MLAFAGGGRVVSGMIACGQSLMLAAGTGHVVQALFEEQTSHVSWLSRVRQNQHGTWEEYHEDFMAKLSFTHVGVRSHDGI